MSAWGAIITDSKKRAEKKKVKFKLSEKQLDNLFKKQNGRCGISGVKMTFIPGERNRWNPFKVSIDRIDNNRGYTSDNIRLVCLAVNLALNTWGSNVFDKIVLGRYGVLKDPLFYKDTNGTVDVAIEEEQFGSMLIKESFVDKFIKITKSKLRIHRIEGKNIPTFTTQVRNRGSSIATHRTYKLNEVVDWIKNNNIPADMVKMKQALTTKMYANKMKYFTT